MDHTEIISELALKWARTGRPTRERDDGPRVPDSASRMPPGQRKSGPPVVGRPVAPLAGRGFAASRGAYWASARETPCDFGAILEEK